MKQFPKSINELRGKSYGVEHILSPQTGPLSEILQNALQLDLERTSFLLKMGAIYHKGERLENVTSDFMIEKEDYLRVHQNPRRFPTEVLNPENSVVWENDDLLILNKPSGLPVHPTVDNTQENIVALLEKNRSLKFYVTHRLDVATQGLLVLAKTKPAQALMNTKLMNNEVRKLYRAQVSALENSGAPHVGEIVHYMEPSPRAPKKVSLIEQADWQICRLKILESTPIENRFQLIIELITGRTHQIRAQMSALGFPVWGDHTYGSPARLADFEKISLQAFSLQFQWNHESIDLQLPESSLKV